MLQRLPYRLRLKTPMELPGGIRLTERAGVLLHDPDSGGWGDAAPLPGFSRETFDDVLHGEIGDPSLPSLAFAADCARKPWPPSLDPVPINALWFPDRETPAALARRLRNWSNPCVKLKPGPNPEPQLWLDLLRRLPGLRLRIDANRAWTVEQTLRMWEALPPEIVDYFEEPLSDAADYAKLWALAPVPIALDESLLRPEGSELARAENVRALVLKPTLLGGAAQWGKWVSLAKQQGIALTWSSCFESGVGLLHLAALACGHGAAGLDTNRLLAEDLVHPRPNVRRGELFPIRSLFNLPGCTIPQKIIEVDP